MGRDDGWVKKYKENESCYYKGRTAIPISYSFSNSTWKPHAVSVRITTPIDLMQNVASVPSASAPTSRRAITNKKPKNNFLIMSTYL